MTPCRFAVALVVAVLCWAAAAAAQPQPSASEIPPAPPLVWFRGNLHTHSLWSDGNDFPEMIADWYARQGYHFLAISDHNVLSEGLKWISQAEIEKRGAVGGIERYRQRFGDEWVETRRVEDQLEVRLKPLSEFRALVEERGRFLLIPAEEITDLFQQYPVHVNATNIRELIKPQGGSSVRETIRNNLLAVQRQSQRTGQPMLAHLNHPNFYYAVTAEDIADVVQERFLEIYNGHPEVHHRGDETHPGVERLWDIANTLRIAEMQALPLLGVAVDDTHNYFGLRGASPGRGWIMVRSRHLTPETILAALGRADFYASSGVSLRDVRYDAESRRLELEIEPEDGVAYRTDFIGTLENYDRTREAVLGDDGKPLPQTTLRYSSEIGRVLATVEGTKAAYRLQGPELYVRAVVTSDRAPDNPAWDGQKAQAWTQPVGWETRVKP